MQIVVLDGHTTNPGDLSWDALTRLGPCRIHDRTAAADVVGRAAGAELLLVNKVLLDAATLRALPRLRYIGLLSTGVNVVDLEAAKACGITVCNVPAYSTPSVAQMVFALLNALLLRVEAHSEGVHGGRWSSAPDFCYWDGNLVELDGLTLGLVGFGQIGQAVTRIAHAYGMDVVVHTRSPGRDAEGLRFADLDGVFRVADVVSLHCPLTPATAGLADARRLGLMKPGAYLINTGRGGLVDEGALAEALRSGRLGGAGLDVLSVEPPPPDHPLLRAPRCVITPHIAWATRAARQRLLATAAGNVRAFLEGRPRNVVR